MPGIELWTHTDAKTDRQTDRHSIDSHRLIIVVVIIVILVLIVVVVVVASFQLEQKQH